MAGAEVGNHGCDRREVANADKSNRRYGDHVGFVSPPCAVGPCPYPPFFYAPGVATTVSDNVTFANGAVAAAPAPPTKRARTEGQFQFLGADGRAKQRKLDVDPVANPHVGVVDLRRQAEAAELERRRWRRRHAMALLVKAYSAAAKHVAMKNVEIERTWRLNRSLATRLRGMHAQALAWRGAALSNQDEALAWRGVALSNQAEATALRADLERALQPPPRPTAEPEDVESCCYGDNGDDLGGAGEEVGSEPATA